MPADLDSRKGVGTCNSARSSDGEPGSEMLSIEEPGKTTAYIAPRSLDQLLETVPLSRKCQMA
jgi:hypothetical protein